MVEREVDGPARAGGRRRDAAPRFVFAVPAGGAAAPRAEDRAPAAGGLGSRASRRNETHSTAAASSPAVILASATRNVTYAIVIV
ncbi:MAG: hypothetical protein KIS78_15725 [Labilithrix sp.]|nr:hypothetical protein [Labilithrix sp.]